MYCLPGSEVQLIASQQTSNIVALAAHLDAKMGLAVIEFGFESEPINLISVVGYLGSSEWNSYQENFSVDHTGWRKIRSCQECKIICRIVYSNIVKKWQVFVKPLC